jgi:ubiquinone/menaquinone biosynthesis C-methylase UbiE
MTTLSPAAARSVYDRIGRAQDAQAFFEDKATDELVAHLKLESARSVFEFGCGTGRFAASLIARHLSEEAVYRAVDLSPVMVELARGRLARYAERASVRLTEGDRRPMSRPKPTIASSRTSCWIYCLRTKSAR